MQNTTGGRSPTGRDGVGLLSRTRTPARSRPVPHFHVHLIPRWVQDGKGFDWTLVPGDPERIRATAERIRAAL